MDAGFDNTQLAFKNVLVQFAYYEVRDEKGYLTFQDHDTTRDGYYFTNGKGIHVNWKKSGDYDQMCIRDRYTDGCWVKGFK